MTILHNVIANKYDLKYNFLIATHFICSLEFQEENKIFVFFNDFKTLW